MSCTVKITGGKSDISLDKVNSKILFYTESEVVLHNSDSIGVSITISGNITPKTKDAVIQLSRWSRDFSDESAVYRQVEISEIQESDKTVVRTYIFPKMFVFSYEESTVEKKESIFTLGLRQREGELQSIEIF